MKKINYNKTLDLQFVQINIVINLLNIKITV